MTGVEGLHWKVELQFVKFMLLQTVFGQTGEQFFLSH